MRSYTVYVCKVCGRESPVQADIEMCEGRHLGLNDISEVKEYNSLVSSVKSFMSILARSNNDKTRQDADDAINKMIEFEKNHGMANF